MIEKNVIGNSVVDNENHMISANYVGDVQDIQARQAIEMMGKTIQSLFYGGIISNQIKQEVALQQKESEKNILAVVDDKIDDRMEARGLAQQEAKVLEKARKNKVSQYLGRSKIDGKDNPRYVLFSGYFFGVIKNKCRQQFHIEDFTDVTPKQYLDILAFIRNIEFNKNEEMNIYKNARIKLDEAYRNNEWDGYAKGAKMKRYYESVFVFKTMELPEYLHH